MLLLLVSEVPKETHDGLLNLLIVQQLAISVDRKLIQEVLDFDIPTETDVSWLKAEADACLSEVSGKVEHFELEFFQDVISKVQQPLLHSQRRILVVEVEPAVSSLLPVMQSH